MSKISITHLTALFYCFAFGAFLPSAEAGENKVVPSKRISLWNGSDYTGWTFFSKDPTADLAAIWSVKNGNAHCAGTVYGYMRTTAAFADYHLHVEWRWDEESGNSGVLLHITGEDKVWPTCIETQLKSENAGDVIVMGGASVREQIAPDKRKILKKESSTEHAPGEWNSYDIFCVGDSIVTYVNGVFQNAVSKASISQGNIGFQSEGAPIEFRNIYVQPLPMNRN